MERIEFEYPFWPKYTNEEISSVKNVLRSTKVNYWFGNLCKSFERAYARYFKHKYALSVCSGSVALDLAVRSLGLKEGDEIIVSPRSYVASASCVINNNLKPVFADIDLKTQNISINEIKKKISKKTKAIVVVHLGGYPAAMDDIVKFCKLKKLKLIEDCSQAHGAKYKTKLVGSFGDISIWSFCYDKIISTGGEGGMILTSNHNFFKRMFAFRDCGKNFLKIKKMKNVIFRWIHDFKGSNYRMTEMQAAIGIIQLKKLKENIKIRNSFCKKIINLNNSYNFLEKIEIPKYVYHAFYRFYFFVNFKKLKKISKSKIINLLNKKGLIANLGSNPEIYLEKCFRSYNVTSLKNAKILKKKSISLCINHKFSISKQKSYLKDLKVVFDLISKKYELVSQINKYN